jgi:hypothetical protein
MRRLVALCPVVRTLLSVKPLRKCSVPSNGQLVGSLAVAHPECILLRSEAELSQELKDKTEEIERMRRDMVLLALFDLAHVCLVLFVTAGAARAAAQFVV